MHSLSYQTGGGDSSTAGPEAAPHDTTRDGIVLAFSRRRQRDDMIQSLIVYLLLFSSIWLGSAGLVAWDYEFGEKEFKTVQYYMHAQLVPVLVAFLLSPTTYARRRNLIMILMALVELPHAFIMRYDPKESLHKTVGSAIELLLRVCLASQTTMTMFISFARPLLGKERAILWGIRLFMHAQTNVDYCTVQNHETRSVRLLFSVYKSLYSSAAFGLSTTPVVTPTAACSISLNYVLAMVGFGVPEMYWRIQESQLYKESLNTNEKTMTFSLLDCWESLVLGVPFAASLCWLAAQAMVGLEASPLSRLMARLSFVCTGNHSVPPFSG